MEEEEEEVEEEMKSEGTDGPGIGSTALPYDIECARMDKSNIILLGPTGCGKWWNSLILVCSCLSVAASSHIVHILDTPSD